VLLAVAHSFAHLLITRLCIGAPRGSASLLTVDAPAPSDLVAELGVALALVSVVGRLHVRIEIVFDSIFVERIDVGVVLTEEGEREGLALVLVDALGLEV
jgi:hypothetical protein